MVYLWNWKAIVNAYYRGSFNSIWELPFGFLQAISFAIGFVTLRKYTNGYHAETYIHCLVLSLFLQSISMVLVKFLNADFL